jgi:ComF family protein
MQEQVPMSCVLCGAPVTAATFCPPCEAELPWLTGERCAVCAAPLPAGHVCGQCLQRAPHFNGVSVPFAYQFPVDALIQAFKYGGRLALARPLAERLARTVEHEADILIPMPLAPRRLADRGYNQALELARIVSRLTRIPVLATAARKVVETPPQVALPWKARARNVRRSFACDLDLAGARVAIVDDVLTTGATLNELARVLRRAGAAEVRGWVIARTLPR